MRCIHLTLHMLILLMILKKVLNGAQAYGIQNLFSIQQPSSAKVARETCNYPMLHQLTDLITHLNQAEVEKKYA